MIKTEVRAVPYGLSDWMFSFPLSLRDSDAFDDDTAVGFFGYTAAPSRYVKYTKHLEYSCTDNVFAFTSTRNLVWY